MTGRFRGFKESGGVFKLIEGTGVLYMNHKAFILKSPIPTLETISKVQVVPASVSQSVYVQNVGHLYIGDIVQYTFKEKSEYFSRVYEVVERSNVVKLMELYRDYVLDDDLTVVRGKFKEHKGEFRAIDTPMTYTEIYTVLGNIWQNPEFER